LLRAPNNQDRHASESVPRRSRIFRPAEFGGRRDRDASVRLTMSTRTARIDDNHINFNATPYVRESKPEAAGPSVGPDL